MQIMSSVSSDRFAAFWPYGYLLTYAKLYDTMNIETGTYIWGKGSYLVYDGRSYVDNVPDYSRRRKKEAAWEKIK